jgi:CDK-activating kinase assembly factor MAT1
MSDLHCPLCNSDSYLNPDIKIYVSPCYHKMCETCLSRIFSHGQAPCPECGIHLRKLNFISQTFEDITVERECKIRKMLHRIFYRKLEDFTSTEEYNDYLEEFEEIVFELMEYKNEQVINKKLEEIKETFGELSRVNIEKDVEEEKQIAGQSAGKEDLDREDKEEAKEKKRKIISFIDELMGNEQHPNQLISKVSKISSRRSVHERDDSTPFNPLEDVEIPPVLITKNNVAPRTFRVNSPMGGYLQSLIVFKGVNSLFDDKI